MKKEAVGSKIYENYPLWIVLLTNLLMIAVYVAGAYIMFKLNIITGILYVLYVIILEVKLYSKSCPSCYYYGRLCAFGKGKLAALFFKKADPKKFCEREINFKDLVPQILATLIPLIIGIALLISRGFDALILAALLYTVLSWFFLNPFIYGKLACVHCKQGKICCPALKFFSKPKKKKN